MVAHTTLPEGRKGRKRGTNVRGGGPVNLRRRRRGGILASSLRATKSDFPPLGLLGFVCARVCVTRCPPPRNKKGE